MKIALLQGRNVVSSTGGSEKVLCQLSSGLAERGHTVSALCADGIDGLPFYPLSDKVDFINLRGSNRNKWSAWWNLRAHLARFQPDIIICFYIRDFLSAALAWPQARCVLMLHCEPNFYLVKMSSFKRWLFRALHARLKVIQVLLPSYKQSALALHDHVVVIPNGTVLVPPVDPNLREKVILSVGRFDRNQKQQHILIAAFLRLADDFPDWRLELWGSLADHSYVDECKALVSHAECKDRIVFAGTTSDLSKVYQRAAFMALPSRYEGFPLVLLEAYAHGLPILGLDSCEAVSQLVLHDKSGLLCENDVAALEASLRKLMQNEALRQELSQGALEQAELYNLDHIIDQWERLIVSVNS